jgi:hypothetical protein
MRQLAIALVCLVGCLAGCGGGSTEAVKKPDGYRAS